MIRILLALCLLFSIEAYSQKASKTPKIVWSANPKIKLGGCLGENDLNQVIQLKFHRARLSIRLLDSENKLIRSVRLSGTFYAIPEIVKHDNFLYIFSDKNGSDGRGIYMTMVELSDLTISEKQKVVDMDKIKLTRAPRLSMVTSPDNNLCLIAAHYPGEKKVSRCSYTVYNFKETKIQYSGSFKMDGKKLDIDLDKVFLSNTGQSFFVTSSAHSTMFNYSDMEVATMQLYVADEDEKNAKKSEFASDIKEHVQDISVKTYSSGAYSVFGLVANTEMTLADRMFVIDFDDENNETDAKLPGSEEEEKEEVKTEKKKEKLIQKPNAEFKELTSMNNGNFNEFVARDLIRNEDGSYYVIYEAAQLIRVESDKSTTFYHLAGNIEIIRLNKDNDKVWQKTIYKNHGRIDRNSMAIQDNSQNYINLFSTFTIVHSGNDLRIVMTDYSNVNKNAITSVSKENGIGYFLLNIESDGDIKKTSIGANPGVKKTYAHWTPSIWGKNVLAFHIVSTKKRGNYGLLNLGNNG